MARTITVARLRVPVVADPWPLKRELNNAIGYVNKFARMVRSAARVAAIGLGVITTAAFGVTLGLRKLAKEAMPLPGIMRAFENNAARAGLSLDALRDAAQGTITDMELMRQANIALAGTGSKLAEAFGRDLPTLLMGARAAAQAQGKSVEYMFDSIVNGVKRATPKLIDNTGLIVKLGEVNQKWADAAGVTVEQMTAQQKSLAILEATVEAVNRLIEETGGLTLTSAQRAERVSIAFQNWAHQAGLQLLPAMDSINDALYKLINDLGPKVVSLFQTRIGPSAAALVEIFAETADKAVQTGADLVERYGKKLEGLAFRALKWGIEVSSQFAIGLIRGASTAIVTAMKFIGKLLTFWMGPGSPPRIAPDIDRWGLNAAAEFLRGFSEAEFDLLEGFQSKLDSALSALVGAGSLALEDADRMFRGLSLQMQDALDKFRRTGDLPVALFERLRQTGGRLGIELANLARLQFRVAEATDRYRQAEERLKNAQEARDDAQSDLTRIMREYNRMLEQGATREELAAKRAEFLAAKDRLRTAEDEIVAAEKQKDLAEDALDPLQKQLSLQERLLDQLTRLVEQQEKLTEEKLKEAVGAALAPPEPPIVPVPDTSGLENAFNEAKLRIKEALREAFAPLTDVWLEAQAAFGRISDAWKGLQKDIDRFWNHPAVKAVREWFSKLFPDVTIKDLARLAGLFVGLGIVAAPLAVVLGTLTGAFLLMLNPLTGVILASIMLGKAWYEQGPRIREEIGKLKEETGKLGDKIKAWWDEDVEWRLKAFAEWMVEQLPLAAQIFLAVLGPTFRNAGSAIKTFWDDEVGWRLKRFAEWMKERLPNDAQFFSVGSGSAFSTVAASIKTFWDDEVGWRLKRFTEWMKERLPFAAQVFSIGSSSAFQTIMTIIRTFWDYEVSWRLEKFETWMKSHPRVAQVFSVGSSTAFSTVASKIKTFWDENVGWRLEKFAEWLGETIPGAAKEIKTKVIQAFEDIQEGLKVPWEFLSGIFDRIEKFWEWLKDKVFDIKINLPKIPDWMKPWVETNSPQLKIHTAYKDLWADLSRQAVHMQPSMIAAATIGAGSVDQSRHTTNYNQLTVHTRATQGTYLQDYYTTTALAR